VFGLRLLSVKRCNIIQASFSWVGTFEARIELWTNPLVVFQNKEISSVVSTWWRERVKELINEERAEDARSLYLEFGEVSPMV
jgi:hypothetical protein